jgi:hypothetical protein
MTTQQPAVDLLAGERQAGESKKAIQACNDWLRLGAGRTLPALLSSYAEIHQNTPPTRSLDTLKNWSSSYGWSRRAAEYDQAWEDRKNAERVRVMNEGLALDYQRVQKLLRLADFLENQLYLKDDQGRFPNVWMADAKMIGTFPKQERVDLVRFNAQLIEQYRKTMDDIASEVGGRIQKQDITSGGQAITVTFNPIPAREKPPVNDQPPD